LNVLHALTNVTPQGKSEKGRKKEKEREREKEREKERERERESKWTEWRVGSFTFGSVNIQLQLSKYEKMTISKAQKMAKTLFFVYCP
jgi:hypothetical protein